MSEFASCYFCGTALDAQIEAYPVVPESAGGGDRPTVDLCPVCRRKLSKVLDVALSAAEGAETTATPLAAGPDPSPLSADHEDPTADLGSEDDEEEPAYAVEPSGEATAVEDEAETDESERIDDERGDTTAGDGSASAASAAETVEADSDDTAADDQTEADAAETAESGSDQPSILSTPAAQKIIKLLQNREFPVEREEIEVVASNAYEIPPQDCDDVIEALVSQGYVGEQGGKLVRPEE